MSLTLPTVSVTPGPLWATENNTAFTTIDSHDHTSGKGKLLAPASLVTPSANADLFYNSGGAFAALAVGSVNQVLNIGAGPTLQYSAIRPNMIASGAASQDLFIPSSNSVFARLPVGVPPQVLGVSPSSLIQWQSAATWNVVSKTTTYVVTGSDDVLIASSGTFTFTLPAASAILGKVYTFKNNGTGVITIARAGSDTIDGITSIKMGSQYDELVIAGDGVSAWNIIYYGITTAATYQLSTGQSITSSVVIVNYDTKLLDPLSSVTTGASWHYTVPVAGRYLVIGRFQTNAVASAAGNDAYVLQSYKNAAASLIIGEMYAPSTSAFQKSAGGGGVITCAAADTIDLRVNGTAGDAAHSLTANVNNNYVSIERIGN